MKSYQLLGAFLAYQGAVSAAAVEPSIFEIAPQRLPRSFDDSLRQVLSPKATISHQPSSAPRWSEYHPPRPGTIVNVATEQDVQQVVRYIDPAPASLSSGKTRSNFV